MSDVREVQLLVIGGGPGGYPGALHAADHGIKVTLVDEDPKLGGVCLNRGCIPSKALLHVAKLIHETREAADWGLSFGEPKIDLDKLRNFVQQKVVGKRLAVRSVVEKQGFWVGDNHVDRVYVVFTGPPANNAAEQVDLVGTVKPAPGNVGKDLQLSQEDAAKVTAEGAYIKASQVTPAN